MHQGPLKSSGDGDGHSRTLASRLRRLRSPNNEQNTPKPPRQIGTRSKREGRAVPAQDQAGTLAPAPTSMTEAPARAPTPTHPLAQAMQRARKKFYKMVGRWPIPRCAPALPLNALACSCESRRLPRVVCHDYRGLLFSRPNAH